MQSVNAAFTAEEKSLSRQISSSLLISWHNQSILSGKTFTIGVSLIGGNDLIGINPGAVGSPGNYKYFDESPYIISLSADVGLNMPQGGMTMGLADAVLDNTSNRFLPRYMGGNSELSTAILPRKPMIMNAGFAVNGVNTNLPLFSGLINAQPALSVRDKQMQLQFADYISYFQNKYLDRVVMFTSQFTDQVIKVLFTDLGMSTAQYKLDVGINKIPFGIFDVGTRVSDAIGQLVEAENGQLFQDESGIFRFWNRQKFTTSPYNTVQKVVSTSMVIDSQVTNTDHIVNVVEINSKVRQKQPLQTIFTLAPLSSILVPANSTTDQIFQFQDPVLALTDPSNGGANSYFLANDANDGSGTDYTSNIQVKNLGTFAQAVKYRFTNTSNYDLYIWQLVLGGRAAIKTSDLYYRQQDDSSVTAYQEKTLTINNDFIQDPNWAATYAGMMLQSWSNPDNLQKITVKAMPDLQLGDLISWQGRYWRIFDKKDQMSAANGYTQDLLILQQTITTYFIIGYSTIGGSDKISP